MGADPLPEQYDRVRVPVLHISGWYDDEQIGTPLNFIGMATKGATPEARRSQKLLIGPWAHAINSSTKLGEVEFGPDGRDRHERLPAALVRPLAEGRRQRLMTSRRCASS